MDEDNHRIIVGDKKVTLKHRIIQWLARGDLIILNCNMHCPVGWQLHRNKLGQPAFLSGCTFRAFDPQFEQLTSIDHTMLLQSVPEGR